MRVGLSKTLNGCAVAATLLLSSFAMSPAAHAEEKLVVWWNKGFYSAEEDALLQAIHKFEAKTGVKVELSQYATQDIIPKTVAALDSGTVPDVAYADTFNFQSVGKWAAEGKLEDLSSVLDAAQGSVRQDRARDGDAPERADQVQGLLRLPGEAGDAASALLEKHARGGRSQGE